MDVLVAFIGLLALLGMFWQLLGLISPKIARAYSRKQALKRAGLCLLTVIVLVILTPSRNSMPVSSKVEEAISASSKVEEAASSQERRGNTVGNIVNGGRFSQEGEWIYYANRSDYSRIYKIRTDGSGRTKLCDDRAAYINVMDGWIYYASGTDDGPIYKIRTDGSGRTKLCDDRAAYINVVDGWIYYANRNDDSRIYKIHTDGSGRTRLSEDMAYYINVVDGWIYYSNKSGGMGAYKYRIYKMSTDGSDRTRVGDDVAFYINVVDGWIYYINVDDGRIYKIRTDGSSRTKLNDHDSGYINVANGWIYYTNGFLGGPIFKIRTDSSSLTKLSNDETGGIHVLDGWIYYVGGEEGIIYKIRTDGSGRTKLNQVVEDARVEKNTKTEVLTPTKIEAIKAFNAAHQYYNDSYGSVPDDLAKKRMIEGKKKIIESFPANWKCGLLVARYVDSKGNFGCDYYPLIETKDGYYYGEYYLKGVEVKEVKYNNIYRGNLSPVSIAEKNPIAIWRSSSLWEEKQHKIWDDNYWITHGQYNDPDLVGAEWLPLN